MPPAPKRPRAPRRARKHSNLQTHTQVRQDYAALQARIKVIETAVDDQDLKLHAQMPELQAYDQQQVHAAQLKAVKLLSLKDKTEQPFNDPRSGMPAALGSGSSPSSSSPCARNPGKPSTKTSAWK